MIYLLSLCLFGSFTLLAQPRQILLNNGWKAQKATAVSADGSQITGREFQLSDWLEAVVPGTILTTLLHNKLVPDPLFGLNNTKIPDIYTAGRDDYTYWFYREFDLPGVKSSEQVWLSFRGINYFAEIFLNGKKINPTTHQGMYLRERYLVTPYLNPGKNRLAVWVAPPDPAGNPNGGQGGDGTIAKNVAMQFTAGWDWICSIPDRNTGIWDQVSLEVTGSVEVKNSYVETRVPGIRLPGRKQDPAFLHTSTVLNNCSDQQLTGVATAEVDGQKVKLMVDLQPGEEKTITFPEIVLKNPRLWWPNEYGDHPLYPVRISYTTSEGNLSDKETIPVGIRETSHSFDPTLKSQIFTVNGQRIFIKGGNWIASDALLRLSKERYEAEIRLHAEMNMNMIRVWGGSMTERPEFYDACDKQGILVWQDLWISGDCNGEWGDPSKKESQLLRKDYPDDHGLFLASVDDQVKMLRNHPSLFLWCGGNETYPPKDLLDAIELEILPRLDPTRFFLNKSTSPELMTNEKGDTGDGPYGILEPADMFLKRSFPFNPEIGSVALPNFDGLKKIIPEEEMQVPLSAPGTGSWAYHKYHSFHDFPDRYGKVKGVEDYCKKVQIVSYEQYRALQESFNYKMWEWYTGMLVWKNQNPWTALRGSFYDYFLDYQGGYFGYKHGATPLHIQLNLNDSVVCAFNQTLRKVENGSAVIRLFDLHGKLLSERKEQLSLDPQAKKLLGKVELPKSGNGLFFLRLQILAENGQKQDENFYWLTTKAKSYEALNELGPAKLVTTVRKNLAGKTVLTLSNPGKETAFFIRLSVEDQNGTTLLPVYLDENYFTLLPGESRKVRLDLSGSAPVLSGGRYLVAEGWNSGISRTKL